MSADVSDAPVVRDVPKVSLEVPAGSGADVERASAANVGAGLWKGLGMWAWLLFRISGLILVGYLFVHIWVISQGRAAGPQSLDDLFRLFDKPILVLLDFMLVAAVLYHALNGVRILLMDLGVGIGRHKLVFWVCMAIAAAAGTGFAIKASAFIF